MMNVRMRGAIVMAVFLLCGLTPQAFAARIPSGFRVVEKKQGVALYARLRDYVHVVSPSEGGAIDILHGYPTEQGAYVTFERRAMSDWWKEWAQETQNAFSVVNGQFFDTSDPSQSPLAFSIKAQGKVYEGYADSTEFVGKKKMLILSPTRYAMTRYSDDAMELVARPEGDIVVGLTTDARKQVQSMTPRTFIGVTREGNAIVLSSSRASQSYADRILRMFGADPQKTMMLDGGSSAHLVHNTDVLVPRTVRGNATVAREKLPQVLGIRSGVGERAER